MKAAARFLMLSAALHLAAAATMGAALASAVLIGAGLLSLGLAAGLSRAMRGLAWLTFLLLPAGTSFAIFLAATPEIGPAPLYWAIAACNICASLGLFAALWRDPPARNA
ncbi:hypothetical protein [Roseisalinus antarcticus]|uniref:Integral membrane protein n=1 Tax=Roseisalinus antarcticus TaxID=254357 RepID=A0A1Y5TTY9_9RHOB|nr:hypothetical protein [Roseisalinus antarcticus]SLN68031.1 hypothetical protein ROA7023_03288 [Roseisalinus antarcticus]